MDILGYFWPESFNSLFSFKVFNMLRYKNRPTIPIFGESPFYETKDTAFYMPIQTVFAHSARFILMKAILEDDLSLVKYVLDGDRDRSTLLSSLLTSSTVPQSALSLAAMLDRPLILQYLMLRGAPLDLPDPQGNTPLLQAVDRASLSCLSLLIDHGADPEIRNKFGEGARERAARKGMRGVEEYLRGVIEEKTLKGATDSSKEGVQVPKFPAFELKHRFEKQIETEQVLKPLKLRSFFNESSVYPFNSLTQSYVLNVYREEKAVRGEKKSWQISPEVTDAKPSK